MLRRCVLLGTFGVSLAACGGGSAPAPARPEAAPVPARTAATGVRLVTVGRFDQPLYVTAPPGDRRRIFVVGQGGKVWVVRGGKRLAAPFLDISGEVQAGGEHGLLGLAFAPDYARGARFYGD